MTGGFNTGFVEIRTLEGDKFLKNIRINEAVKTRRSYTLVNGLYVREMKPKESVYNIYYSAGKEGILNRCPVNRWYGRMKRTGLFR